MSKTLDKEFERKLWASADALRGNISSENYMHIVIGILFLKHMSDKYDSAVAKLKKNYGDDYKKYKYDKDLLEGSSFVVPEKASWNYIEQFATQPEIGLVLDNAFTEIEEVNVELRGLFDKNYNRSELDQTKLGQVVSEFSNIDLENFGEDVIGRVYEYFLGEFFLKQGQKGGEFYTPKSIVDLICRIVDPKEGKLYDPTAGTGGMFVQARESIKKQNGDPDSIVAYGQEYQNKTWRLSKVNLLLHGFPIENIKLGAKSADTFTEDQHKGEHFDYIMANPPFNVKVWGYEKLQDDPRWEELGMPPKGNANYAFLSHMIYKLKDSGRGATVLANGSLSGSGKDEVAIRKAMIEKNYIDAIIALPDKLFYTTGIPVCIWVFNKNKKNKNVLMINAEQFEGNMLSKKNRELTEDELNKIVGWYKDHLKGNEIENEIGYAKTVTQKEIEENEFSFVPGRYVGIYEEPIDIEETKKEIKKAGIELKELFEEMNELIPQVEKSIDKIIK